jgi:hypothetical protein
MSLILARHLSELMLCGLRAFPHFIPQPPPVNLLAIQFLVAVSASYFSAFFFAMQLLGGLLHRNKCRSTIRYSRDGYAITWATG